MSFVGSTETVNDALKLNKSNSKVKLFFIKQYYDLKKWRNTQNTAADIKLSMPILERHQYIAVNLESDNVLYQVLIVVLLVKCGLTDEEIRETGKNVWFKSIKGWEFMVKENHQILTQNLTVHLNVNLMVSGISLVNQSNCLSVIYMFIIFLLPRPIYSITLIKYNL